MKKEAKIYMVWQDGEDEQFWNQYDSIEDAVSDEGDEAEVYAAEPKYLGRYKRKSILVKPKKRLAERR